MSCPHLLRAAILRSPQAAPGVPLWSPLVAPRCEILDHCLRPVGVTLLRGMYAVRKEPLKLYSYRLRVVHNPLHITRKVLYVFVMHSRELPEQLFGGLRDHG